jgi:membrane protease YdiL (CAAX protease family)
VSDRPAPSAPSALDALLLPDGLPRGGGSSPAGWGRRVGTVLLWGGAQAGFLFMPPLAAAAYNLALGAAFVWWFVLRRGYAGEWRRRATLRLRPVGRSGPWIPLLGVALVAFVLAGFVVTARFLPLPQSSPNDPLEAYLRRPYGALAVLTLVAVVAPLLEEFLFRGWLQRTLERRMAAWQAIVLATTVFALAHFQTFGFPLRFAFSLVVGYLAWGTRSVWPGVLLHGIYNGSLIAFSAIAPRVTERELVQAARSGGSFAAALSVLVVSGAVLAWGARRAVAGVEAERAARIARAAGRPRLAAPATPASGLDDARDPLPPA